MNALAANDDAALKQYGSLFNCADDTDMDIVKVVESAERMGVLGDENFAARVGTEHCIRRSELSLEDLVTACCARFSVTNDLLISPLKCRVLCAARAWIAHEAALGRVCSISAVARRLARSESSMRELIKRYAVVSPRPGLESANPRPGT
jgi:hypothetical protein